VLEVKFYGYVFDSLLAGFKELPVSEKLVSETREALGGVNLEVKDTILDRQVRDPARVVRLPFTRHEATGNLAYVVDWRSFKLLKIADILRLGLLDQRLDVGLIKSLITVLEHSPSISLLFTSVKRREVRKLGKILLPGDPRLMLENGPPCIKAIYQKFKARIEVSHDERLAVLWFLTNLGYKPEEIIEVYKMLPDYDERKTEYRVRYGYVRKYMMHNCETMRNRGLVSEELCEKCPVRERGYKNPLCWRFIMRSKFKKKAPIPKQTK